MLKIPLHRQKNRCTIPLKAETGLQQVSTKPTKELCEREEEVSCFPGHDDGTGDDVLRGDGGRREAHHYGAQGERHHD